MLVDEPGAETPIFMPFMSAGDEYFAFVETPIAICGARPCSTKALKYWLFACRLIVCS